MIRFLPLLAAGALLSACSAPDLSFAFHQMEVETTDTPAAANERFAKHISKARHTVQVALPALEDLTISDALIDAWTKGRDVEVVTDIDRASDPGVVDLIDAGVPVTLADGELTYFDFNLNNPVLFQSANTRMSHTWAVIDRQSALVGTQAGDLSSGEKIFFELQGEELIEDLLSEHNQVFGGTDATATTAFDGLAKSITDVRWRYPSQTDVDLEMWFGPQERLIKRMIDAVYYSRGEVMLLTNDLTDPGMARALEDKAKYGFPVTAVVGPEMDAQANRLSRVFTQETPNVVKRRYTAADDMPTLLITDWGTGIDGKQYDTRVFVLTHDIYTTSRIEGASPPVSQDPDEPFLGPVTDQLIDGTLWVLVDYDEPSGSTQAMYDLFQRHLEAAGAL